MKLFRIIPNHDSPTLAGCVWSIEKREFQKPKKLGKWDPADDTFYEIAGNNWGAAGPLTASSASQLSNLWALARGSDAPLTDSHVIGLPNEGTAPTLLVGPAFAEAFETKAPGFIEFTPHDKVWDLQRQCPPWDGTFFIASVLRNYPSYDLDASAIRRQPNTAKRFQGSYWSIGTRRAVKESVIKDVVWRDAYTRDILCTDTFLEILNDLGVTEWTYREIEVI